MLLKILDFISDILEKIFNQILKEGIIPDAFKNALISPIYKGKGSKTDLISFRQISLLNVFSKIFEKAIKTMLINYLEENNLLPNSQYGFRKGLCTEDALANLTKDIYDNLNNYSKTIGIFLDFSKAFDSIPHPKLLNCIKSFDIIGSAYTNFKSYLEGRTQQVKVSDKLSDIGIIHRGVPQGTVLSQILYIIYVSALDGLSLIGRIYSYADDTAIIVSSSNWESTWQKSESDIAVLDKWFSNNDLKINFDKSKCIAFTNNTRTEPNKKELNIHKINCITISCSCPKLSRHASVKYLGILIDQNLKWNMHIDNLINKIRQLT